MHTVKKYQLYKFWDDEFKNLDYVNEPFNDTTLAANWTAQGYPDKFTGDMCDMRSAQPSWNQRFVDIFSAQGWQDIGTSYYRMNTGTVLPTHGDLYLKYIDLFNLQRQESSIRRAVVFLNDWEPGHYAEYCNEPFVNWSAGSTVEWSYDTLHMAANLGPTPRYTLQITGHL
tara:strand:+ start:555 stop:1067 length:513 start_codon:yes stop_codon:yes gene_type:complete